MSVMLSPETEKLIEDRMKSGGFPTADDVVRCALETLGPQDVGVLEDLDEETLAAIAEGEAQADRGETRPWEEVRAEFLARVLRK